MKLFLTSYRIPDPKALMNLIGKADTVRVAIIPNAKDYYVPRVLAIKSSDNVEYLSGLGLASEVVDLADYSEAGQLLKKLSEFDCIWVSGGNTFCLRYQMQRSGFDQIIKTLLENDVVYAGESAGACVVGTTLKGIETADDPRFAESVIYPGLSLIPHVVLPHTDNPMFENDVAYMREMYKDNSSLLELTDSEALSITNGEITRIQGTYVEL